MGDGSSRGEVYRDEGGQWRYRLVGGNGEKMVPSEPYPTKDHAVRGYRDMRSAASDAPADPEVIPE